MQIALTSSAGSSPVDAGSSAVTINATVSNDTKSGGVTFSLSPATGCGTLTSSGTASASYTPPSAASLNSDCTATVTATAVDSSTTTSTITVTIKAITVTLNFSGGTTLGAGAGAVTLTAALGNEVSSNNDTVVWTFSASGGGAEISGVRGKTRRAEPRDGAIASACGTFDSNGTSATYTPPSTALPANCTATITAASTVNSNVKTSTTFTVNALTMTVTPPASTSVGEGGTSGAIAAAIGNNGSSDTTVNWSLTPSGCGSISSATGASVTYTAPAPISSACGNGNSVTITATADADSAATGSATLTILPIAVTLTPPSSTTVVEGATSGSIAASMSNDGSSDTKLDWSVSPTGCGTLSAAQGSSVTYTAPSPIPAACNGSATVKVASDVDSSKSATTTLTISPITVTITSPTSSPTVVEGSTQAITATTNDPAGANSLKWSITGCGNISANTGASVTYAPPTPPLSSSCTAVVTVASATDGSKTQTLNVTAAPITVSITSPTTPQTMLSGSSGVSITASTNDPKGGSDLSWKLSSASCGTLSAGSGLSVTFNPPALLAATCSVTVTVYSAYDTTQQATLNITVNPAPVVVTVTSPSSGSASLLEGQTLGVTATIYNDAAGAGLGYNLNPNSCGSFSGFTKQGTSGATTTYTGTYTAPKNGACNTVLTVGSSAYPATPATVNITVNPITVSITSPSGSQTVSSGSSGFAITAATNDPAGVNSLQWSMSGCGSISTNTGASSTYTPPATLASQCTATVTVASSTDSSKTATLSITVNPAPITLTITSPTGGTGTVATGGTLAVLASIYNDANSKGIGYSLSSSSCGTFTGMTLKSSQGATSNYSGTFNATPGLTSSCNTTLTLFSNQTNSVTATLSITVSPGIVVTLSPDGSMNYDANGPLAITPTVQNDAAGKGVNLSLTGCGSLSASTEPSGTAFQYNPPSSVNGTCSAVIKAASISNANATDSLALTVYPALSLPANPGLPSGTVGVSYNANINAGGGQVPGNFTWTVTGLSDGITSNAASAGSTLVLSGLPTAAATVNFQVTVKDATGTTVGPMNYSITVNPYTAPSLPAQTMPTAFVGQSYGAAINVNGGVQTFNFSITINSSTTTIPTNNSPVALTNGDGLTAWNSGGNTLSIGGTPSSPATVNMTVSVTDGENNTASQNYTVTVTNAAPLTFNASAVQVPQGMVNMPYTMNPYNSSGNNSTVSGGVQPYTFSYSNTPSWAGTDSYGNLAGTPTAAGTSTVTVTVKDNSGQTASGNVTFNVVPQTVAVNSSKLTGQYACIIHKLWDSPVVVNSSNLYVGINVVSLALDGNGNLTGGEVDSNDPKNGYETPSQNGSVTGSYAVGSDNRGYILINRSGKTALVFALAAGDLDSNGDYAELRLASMGDAGTSPYGKHGGGLCYRQYNSDGSPVTTSNNTLSSQTLSGGIVWGMNGETSGGQMEMSAGSGKISGGSLSGVIDQVTPSGAYLDQSFGPETVSSVDQWGRVVFTCTSNNCGSSVGYITNQKGGKGFAMTTDSHSAGNDIMFGQFRTQNASQISAAEPITGNFVMYLAGTDSPGSGNFKVLAMQGTGSSSAASVTVNTSVQNNGGTMKFNEVAGANLAYTADPNTGRVTFAAEPGDVMYLWGTNTAIMLFADGNPPQQMLGWLVPQDSPTANSGKWVYTDLATSFYMGEMFSGDVNTDSNIGTFSIDTSGNFHNFAQDDGGIDWVDWDEGMGGQYGVSSSGVVVPDTTLDPNGTYGVFDVNVTVQGQTQTAVYCVAESVDSATNSNDKGGLLCVDSGSNNSPHLTIIAE